MSIRAAWESERRFPLNTVALLRSALAKHGFAYFKHDKNVTYITKIRRKRFETLDGLADGIRNTVLYLREHPGASRKQLVEHFLGKVTETAETAPVPADPSPVNAQPAETAPETTAEPAAAESAVAEQSAEAAAPIAAPAPEAIQPAAASSTPADVPQPAPIVTPEDKIMADLHWLIIDGYVVEFSDGRLMAWPDAPPKPEPTPAPEATTTETPAASSAEPAPADAPSDVVTSAEPSTPEPTPSTETPAPAESNVAPEPSKDSPSSPS